MTGKTKSTTGTLATGYQEFKVPPVSKFRQQDGASIVVVHRPTVPIVELRLILPVFGASRSLAALAAKMMGVDLEDRPITYTVDCNADRIVVSGFVLNTLVEEATDLLRQVISGSYLR